jgi:GTP pyrophosphokinase
MRILGGAPAELEMVSLQLLSSYSSRFPAWELSFNVANLYGLQKIIKHFDKSKIPYEFDLDC